MIFEKWKANPRWWAERALCSKVLLSFRGKGMNYL